MIQRVGSAATHLKGYLVLSPEKAEKAQQAQQQAGQACQLRQALIEKIQQRGINLDDL